MLILLSVKSTKLKFITRRINMRMLIKATIPTEKGNASLVDGSMMTSFESILEDLKPEAVYLTIENGARTMLLIINMEESSEMLGIVEPLFLSMGAHLTLTPVATAEDFEKAGPGLGEVIQKYAS